MRSKRLNLFSSAVFYELSSLTEKRRQAGLPVFPLGIGSPDLPPPLHSIEVLRQALLEPSSFSYQRTEGLADFRASISRFMAENYSVQVDPDEEVLPLIGAQDGLSHIMLALVDPGDIVLIPDPGYPIYEVAVHLAGATPYFYPLQGEHDFLPDWTKIPQTIAERAKLMVLNFPGNPTAVVGSKRVFEEAIYFARQNEIAILHDAAYIEMQFDGHQTPSFLSIPGAKEIAIELHSLSKTYNFAGARVAFAVGQKEMLEALRIVKSQVDYGIFRPVQKAATALLTEDYGHRQTLRLMYQERRDHFLAPLHAAGWDIRKPEGTMFVFAHTFGQDSRAFARRLLEETGVVCVPGIGFGPSGEGYVRFALVTSKEALREVAEEIVKRLDRLR
ncbi:LL-diaminopimelate aminotransferase [Ferroacidibacillus organovorans]|uniref:Aminotransferase n=1 Tax=Ferroacidibacillus organovorans TaxID=1765683 RepID=A0A117SXB8_9BACL|nr:LL-diaminopimelate aminotransferase [Ferroacidibacillus organovorans]